MNCLNCNYNIKSELTAQCPQCGWITTSEYDRADLDYEPVFSKSFEEVYSYAPLSKKAVESLPEGLKEAVVLFLTDPDKITKKQYDNLTVNIRKYNVQIAEKEIEAIKSRIEVALFVSQYFSRVSTRQSRKKKALWAEAKEKVKKINE